MAASRRSQPVLSANVRNRNAKSTVRGSSGARPSVAFLKLSAASRTSSSCLSRAAPSGNKTVLRLGFCDVSLDDDDDDNDDMRGGEDENEKEDEEEKEETDKDGKSNDDDDDDDDEKEEEGEEEENTDGNSNDDDDSEDGEGEGGEKTNELGCWCEVARLR